MTNKWQNDGKSEVSQTLVKTLDNGSTLTDGRTDGLTNDLQDQGSNRLVPDTPTPVDKGDYGHRIEAAPNRVVEHSPGPDPQIGTSDWRAAMQSTEIFGDPLPWFNPTNGARFGENNRRRSFVYAPREREVFCAAHQRFEVHFEACAQAVLDGEWK